MRECPGRGVLAAAYVGHATNHFGRPSAGTLAIRVVRTVQRKALRVSRCRNTQPDGKKL